MNVVGVITEYNPFHNGHKYQLDYIRHELKADYIVIAMSGNFVQRGTPALVNKYVRANMALSCGADLVLELPTVFSTSSASYFAEGGVNLLASTNCINYLCYGAETDDTALIRSIADILTKESDDFKKALAQYLKVGDNFPVARKKALSDVVANTANMNTVLSMPNNILAIEYEKALAKTNIKGHALKRNGEDYHSTNIDSNYSSASAIRKYLKKNKLQSLSEDFSHSMPQESLSLLSEYIIDNNFLFEDSISDLLYYKLSMQSDFRDYLDCTEELSAKISNNLHKFTSFSSFCELLKSKNMTHSRISRVLLHILLDIKCDDLNQPDYLRVLGFRKRATTLLHEIKKNASAPLITKVADAPDNLLSKDIFASNLYYSLARKIPNSSIKNEFLYSPIIIP